MLFLKNIESLLIDIQLNYVTYMISFDYLKKYIIDIIILFLVII